MRTAGLEERRKAILSLLQRNLRWSTRDIQVGLKVQHNITVSQKTVWNDLAVSGCTYRPRRSTPWKGRDPKSWAAARLAFANEWVDRLTSKEENIVLFSDESMFRCVEGKKYVWCHPGQQPPDMEVHKWSASCHVWGCMGPREEFNLIVNVTDIGTGPRGGITSEDYLAMLTRYFLPKLRRWKNRYPSKNFVFIQDGARIHTTDEALQQLASWDLQCFESGDWPACSPDLNPIENYWGISKRGIDDEICRDLSQTSENARNLWEAVERYFVGSGSLAATLYASWDTRLRQVIARKGGRTDY